MKDANKGQAASLRGEGLSIGIVRARFNDDRATGWKPVTSKP